MNLPEADNYIDIHTHDCKSAPGIFTIENLMAHETRMPEDFPEQTVSFGIHPWFLNENNYNELIEKVIKVADCNNLIAIGEAGFDKIRGPSVEVQRRAFEEQVKVSEAKKLPVIIHCVRAWEELLAGYKKLQPSMPWLVHGFRGSRELASQLLSKGIYISFWFDFIVRPESSDLIRSIPGDRIFLETDGSDVDIRDIYKKVSTDLNISVDELKEMIFSNFNDLINIV